MATTLFTNILNKNTKLKDKDILKAIKDGDTTNVFILINFFKGTIYVPFQTIIRLLSRENVVMISFLADRGYPITCIRSNILNELVIDNKLEMMALLFSRGCLISSILYSTVDQVIRNNQVDMMGLLFSSGFLISSIRYSTVDQVIGNNHVKMLELFFSQGYPLLIIHRSRVNEFVRIKKIEMLNLFLSNKYPVYLACSEEEFITAIEEKDFPLIETLVMHGMLNNKPLANKCFKKLIMDDDVTIVRLFLDHGVSCRTCSNFEFELIVKKSQKEMIELLVRRNFLVNNPLDCYSMIITDILKFNPSLAGFLIDHDQFIVNSRLTRGKIVDPEKSFPIINIIVKIGLSDALHFLIGERGINVLDNVLSKSFRNAITYLHHDMVRLLFDLGVDFRNYFSQSYFEYYCKGNSRNETMIELLLSLGIYYPNRLSIDLFSDMVRKDNVSLMRLLTKHGFNIFSFPSIVFENAMLNNTGPLVINKLCSIGYCSVNSENFKKHRHGTKENIEAMLALAPLARRVDPLLFEICDKQIVISVPRTTYASISLILSYIGGTIETLDHCGEFVNFSRILFDNFVFTSHLQDKRKGFVCSLLQRALFPLIQEDQAEI